MSSGSKLPIQPYDERLERVKVVLVIGELCVDGRLSAVMGRVRARRYVSFMM